MFNRKSGRVAVSSSNPTTKCEFHLWMVSISIHQRTILLRNECCSIRFSMPILLMWYIAVFTYTACYIEYICCWSIIWRMSFIPSVVLLNVFSNYIASIYIQLPTNANWIRNLTRTYIFLHLKMRIIYLTSFRFHIDSIKISKFVSKHLNLCQYWT